MNFNSVVLLRTHGHYLKQVINNIEDGQRIIDKEIQLSKRINMKAVNVDQQRFGTGERNVVFTISGNYNSMGIVHNVTSQVTALLGYKKIELLAHRIRLIQPQVWGERHYDNMMRYFLTLKATVIKIERPIFPINTRGYIIGCSIYVKILP